MKIYQSLLAALLGVGLLIGAGAASAAPMMNMTKPEVQSSVQTVHYRRHWHGPRHHRPHYWGSHRSYRSHYWRGHHYGWYKHRHHHHHRYYRY
ncbi:hypothetical protein HGP16_26535 [Rhizobium sp. P40RR-XXII]|uniref:hypothetical protein n=1 Tax=unclassified Rhizobium TaxID=2613769 RepID=UPI00145713B1|nr:MULTISPECIES: hypothetical protein [unclassified Rhizobium]NLR85437.1 hypothetical protein [Rhizobium sp. P28RR-XV]NLS20097.1 hypothetical protein [Rhizobium sp. P40RR-XXII]